MYKSSYNPGSRYKRRANEQRRKIFIMLLFFAIVSGLSYWFGGEVVRGSEVAYKQQALTLRSDKESLEDKVTELSAQVQSTQARYNQLNDKYEAEVPTGKLKSLTDLARKQLKDGIAADRLAFVIKSARPPRNCTKAATKRFVIRTESYHGPDSAVAFASGTISITGEGSAAKSDGGVEAWFDPGKTVKVRFARIGGKDIIKEALLPIQHSMVVGDREYRFTVAKGNRSFVNVTSDSCDYP